MIYKKILSSAKLDGVGSALLYACVDAGLDNEQGETVSLLEALEGKMGEEDEEEEFID